MPKINEIYRSAVIWRKTISELCSEATKRWFE